MQDPDEPVGDLPPVRVGPDTYSAQVCTRSDRGLLSLTYTYQVERDEEIVRVEAEEFTMWPATPETMRDELLEAGLTVRGTADGLLHAARRR